MKPKVQADRVVVKPLPKREKTASGFFITEEPGSPAKATVVDVGPGARSKKGVVIPMTVAVGDTVLYNEGSGVAVKLQGEDLLVLKESDIMGIQDE